MKKFICLIIILSFLISACGSGADDTSTFSASNSLIYSEETDEPITQSLTVGYTSSFSQVSPLFSTASTANDIICMTSVFLTTFDGDGNIIKNAIQGENISVNGYECVYTGISDIRERSDTDGAYTIELQLSDKVCFSDKEKLTADDLIFTMYLLCDSNYDGPYGFSSLPIKGLDEYKSTSCPLVSGIKKENEYCVSVSLNSMPSDLYQRLTFPIIPLHYYGDVELYDYESNSFGFAKGEIDKIKSSNKLPMGAGAFRCTSMDAEQVIFESNAFYFKGSPNISKVKFVKMDEIAALNSLADGNCDIAEISLDKASKELLESINYGNLSGEVISIINSNDCGYGYIGINAELVKVGDDKSSQQSRYLRKAFATIFSAYRNEVIFDLLGEDALVNKIVNNRHWIVENTTTNSPYNTSLSGDKIYDESLTDKDRYDRVINASLEYFMEAGYIYDPGVKKFISAPNGASLEYNIVISYSEEKLHPVVEILENVKVVLDGMGIDLKIVNVPQTELFFEEINSGNCAMWVASYSITDDNLAIYQRYHSNGQNRYNLSDDFLDLTIEAFYNCDNKEQKKELFADINWSIEENAVEVPIYSNREITAYSTKRLKIAGDDSNNPKSWLYNIHLLEIE